MKDERPEDVLAARVIGTAMKIADVDIRQIRIFMAVVQSGGFSAAQQLLDLAQSTISTEVASLEARLGYVLCRRGRGGFQLTPRGEAFMADANTLINAMRLFESQVAKHRHGGPSSIRIAVIDNLVSDPACPLVPALGRFQSAARGRTDMSIDVLAPNEIEHGVASGRYDLGLGIFAEPVPHVAYRRLYTERDVLLCGKNHPLFQEADDIALFARIRTAQKVVRTFLRQQDFFFLSDQSDSITAHVDNVEAAAFLILAGHHVGFLPEHYARRWIDAGDMRTLLEKSYTRASEISVIHRQDKAKMSAAALALLREFAEHKRR